MCITLRSQMSCLTWLWLMWKPWPMVENGEVSLAIGLVITIHVLLGAPGLPASVGIDRLLRNKLNHNENCKLPFNYRDSDCCVILF